MSDAPPAQPKTLGGPVPYFSMDANASEASTFYQKAFDAKEMSRMPAQDGKRMMHVHLYINGGSLMMSDAFPEHGHAYQKPEGSTVHLEVDDADTWYNRAIAAGCTVTMPLENMFWGQRYGQFRDPYDRVWSIGGPVKG